jgi:hypothetical protein
MVGLSEVFENFPLGIIAHRVAEDQMQGPKIKCNSRQAQSRGGANVAVQVSFRLDLTSNARNPCDEHADLNAARNHWSSNLVFLIIAVGTEAGIANVWKFSYLAGANGGGLFVSLYFIALVVVAIPALMAEMLIGRRGGRSTVGTMNVLVTRDGIAPFWKLFGIMATTAVFLILSYYCVICGWMVKYFIFGVRGGFKGMDAVGAASTYHAMLADPAGMLFYSGVVLAATAVIVAGGVNKGIERVSSVLTPLRDPDLPIDLLHLFRGYRRGISLLVHRRLDPAHAGGSGDGIGAGVFLARHRRRGHVDHGSLHEA